MIFRENKKTMDKHALESIDRERELQATACETLRQLANQIERGASVVREIGISRLFESLVDKEMVITYREKTKDEIIEASKAHIESLRSEIELLKKEIEDLKDAYQGVHE